MRFSRLAIFALIISTVFVGANCTFYSRILARKALVDGSKAYKDRKFQDAERLFRDAASRDPDGSTVEGKTAQLFLARTLHSEYIGNRGVPDKAEQAIEEYKKALKNDINDQSSYKAIASLLENLGQNDQWLTWVNERANNKN
jgi:tetratricopeptide (TPR) repeat protein